MNGFSFWSFWDAFSGGAPSAIRAPTIHTVDPLSASVPTATHAAASSTSATHRFGSAMTLLTSGSVDRALTQHALTPASLWWLR